MCPSCPVTGPEAAKGETFASSAGSREARARLAGVRIEAEREELCRDGPDIDAAVDDRIGQIRVVVVLPSGSSPRPSGSCRGVAAMLVFAVASSVAFGQEVDG